MYPAWTKNYREVLSGTNFEKSQVIVSVMMSSSRYGSPRWSRIIILDQERARAPCSSTTWRRGSRGSGRSRIGTPRQPFDETEFVASAPQLRGARLKHEAICKEEQGRDTDSSSASEQSEDSASYYRAAPSTSSSTSGSYKTQESALRSLMQVFILEKDVLTKNASGEIPTMNKWATCKSNCFKERKAWQEWWPKCRSWQTGWMLTTRCQ